MNIHTNRTGCVHHHLSYLTVMRVKLLWLILIAAIALSLLHGPTGVKVTPQIYLQFRLPRVLLALFVGGALAFVGAILQAILRNPLVDPYILGTSGGAALGRVIAMLMGINPIVFGFLGSVAATLTVYRIARYRGRLPRETLLLAGVMMSILTSSLVMLTLALSQKGWQEAFYLLMGYLGRLWDVTHMWIFIIGAATTLVTAIYFIYRAQVFNIMLSGEEEAISLGIDVERVKLLVFVLSALIVSFVVILAGSIGFVGLMVPHILRLMMGPDYRRILPYTWVLGGGLLLLADFLSYTFTAFELPVGVITSLAGVPFFLYLLRSHRQ